MHVSWGGGTSWLQPKSNVTFKLALPQLFKILAADFSLNIFIIVPTVPTGLQTCAKVLQMHPSWEGGTPWLQPKSDVTSKSASAPQLFFFAADFEFEYFHYSGHCGHRVANLCKNAANIDFRGLGDTLDATQK